MTKGQLVDLVTSSLHGFKGGPTAFRLDEMLAIRFTWRTHTFRVSTKDLMVEEATGGVLESNALACLMELLLKAHERNKEK